METEKSRRRESLSGDNGAATRFGWRVHCLEVIVLCYCFAFLMNFMISLQFIYTRVEEALVEAENVTLNASSSNSGCATGVADNTSNRIVAQTQNISSSWQLYLSLAAGIPSVFATILLGSFSDRIGRKVLLLLPSFGGLVRAAIYCSVSYFKLSLYYLIAAHAIEGFSGSLGTILLGSFAYTSDITNRGKKRSLRITLMESLFGVAFGIANLSLGYMIEAWGYTIPNIPIMAIFTTSVLMTVFLLPETRKSDQEKEIPSLNKAAYRVFRFYFSSKNDNPRVCYILCICIFLFGSLATVGATAVETLYALNKPLCWNSVQIGYFGTTKAILQSVLSVFAVKLLQFCLSDVGIGIVSGAFRLTSYVLEGFATTSAYMYVAAGIAVTGVATLSMCRSIMSKLTPPGQQGALFASIACIEAITTMTASIGFMAIYQQTLSLYDGTVFFCMAFTISISMGLYLVLCVQLKKMEKEMMLKEQPMNINDDREPLLGSTTDKGN